MTAHLQRADLLLHTLTVQVCVRTSGLCIQLEGDVDIGHLRLQFLGLHTAVSLKQSFSQGIEGDATVHGTRVNIDVADLTGKVLGHSALSTGAVAVDGDGDFLHNV